MYLCIFSHTFNCCYKPLPLCWAFAVLWSFPLVFFFFSSSSCFYFSFIFLLIFQTNYILSTYIPLFAFPTVPFPLQLIFNVYKSSSSTSIFAYLFFLSFLSSQHICSFCFHCLIPYLAPCLVFFFFPVCALVLFLSGKHNFGFPLFTGSAYCTLCLLDCSDFVHGCKYMYVCVFHYFNYYLPDFVWGSSLVSRFWVFVLFSLNAITNHLWNVRSWPEIKP